MEKVSSDFRIIRKVGVPVERLQLFRPTEAGANFSGATGMAAAAAAAVPRPIDSVKRVRRRWPIGRPLHPPTAGGWRAVGRFDYRVSVLAEAKQYSIDR